MHLRNDRFPSQWKSKLSPRGYGPFQVLSRETIIMHISWIYVKNIKYMLLLML